MAKRLSFTIALVDKVTKPLGKVQGNLRRFSRLNLGMKGAFASNIADYSKSTNLIKDSAIGIGGSALALKAALGPAIEMKNALREVSTLDVDPKGLRVLKREGLSFALEFGKSAQNFVKSAYDIQSGIEGLSDLERAKFTRISGIMAMGTKAKVGTTSSFLATMYGIEKEHADKIGKIRWAEKIAGQFGASVKAFKTTGTGMASAFENIGAAATSAGIKSQEQFGILGKLQATMSGSEAGTKYKAFLRMIPKAQEKLGLKFAGDDGKMLSMVDILEKIKTKFGDFEDLETQKVLQEAFGDEAIGLVTLLAKDTDGLRKSIDAIGRSGGMESVTKMAKKAVDPWARFAQVFNVLRIQIGGALLPVMEPLMNKLADFSGTVRDLLEKNPVLAKTIGFVGLGVIGLTASISLFALASGTASMVMTSFRTSILLAQGAMWLFNAVMTANPIGLVIVGVGLLIAGITAAVVYWDEFTSTLADVTEFETIKKWFSDFLDWIPKSFDDAINRLMVSVDRALPGLSKLFGYKSHAILETKTAPGPKGSPTKIVEKVKTPKPGVQRVVQRTKQQTLEIHRKKEGRQQTIQVKSRANAEGFSTGGGKQVVQNLIQQAAGNKQIRIDNLSISSTEPIDSKKIFEEIEYLGTSYG